MADTTDPPTQDEALRIARTFDVVMAQGQTFGRYVSSMKNENPHLVLLEYLNGAFSIRDDGTRYPPGWYARDSRGRMIQSKYDNYLMDLRNPLWPADVAQRCRDELSRYGYDGCFLDTLGIAIFSPGYVTSIPVDPHSSKLWTQADWLNATCNVARTVKSMVGTYKIVPNGLSFGKRYFDPSTPTKKLLDGVDAAMIELFLRSGDSAPDYYRTEADWKLDVDMIIDAAKSGKTVLASTKIWAPATQAQLDVLHKFALTTFLLGTDGSEYFSFVGGKTWAVIAEDNPIDRIDMGSPLNTYAKRDGAYRRDFSNGIVLVNPTDKPVSVPINSIYWDSTGIVHAGSISLAPHSGELLMRNPTLGL